MPQVGSGTGPPCCANDPTSITAPDMTSASSESKNATALAMSSGFTSRPAPRASAPVPLPPVFGLLQNRAERTDRGVVQKPVDATVCLAREVDDAAHVGRERYVAFQHVDRQAGVRGARAQRRAALLRDAARLAALDAERDD